MKKLLYILAFCFLLTSCSALPKKEEENDDIILATNSKMPINIAINSLDTFHPILTKSTTVRDAMQLIFEPLFTLDTAHNPVSVIAQSCTPSSDGYSYTISIKDGISWHDGTALTSKDVVHSFNLIRYNDTVFSKELSCVSGVSVVDTSTVLVKLNRPVPNFCALLTFPIVPNSKAEVATENYIPVGTGMFCYDGKISSDKVRLVPNDKKAGENRSGSEIHLNLLKNNSDILNAFNANEIDAVTSTVLDLQTDSIRGEVNGYDYISNSMSFLGINNTKSVLSGANTRKAISYLIDREDIVTNEIFSRAKSASLPINPAAWYNPKIGESNRDAEYIADMLALDGWVKDTDNKYKRTKIHYGELSPDGEEVLETLAADILVNENNNERVRVAQRIADKLSGFGIESSVRAVSFEDYTLRISEKNYMLFLGEVAISRNMDIHSLLASADNYFGYSSEKMNSAVYRLGVATATDEQMSAYSEFAKLFSDEMPFVPLFFRKENVYFSKSLSGTTPPTLLTPYENAHNWYISTVQMKGN